MRRKRREGREEKRSIAPSNQSTHALSNIPIHSLLPLLVDDDDDDDDDDNNNTPSNIPSRY